MISSNPFGDGRIEGNLQLKVRRAERDRDQAIAAVLEWRDRALAAEAELRRIKGEQ